MLAYDRYAVLWNLQTLGENLSDYEEIYTLKNIDYYYAFNRDTDDVIIAKLQAALNQLKASGKFNEISQRYLAGSP